MSDIEMVPITRKEFYLAGITGMDVQAPSPVTRLESYLNDILNGTVSQLTPLNRVERYLAKISGADVTIPVPVTRMEFYLAAIAGMEVDIPDPVTREEWLLAEWAESLEHTYGPAALVSFETSRAKLVKSLLIALQPIQDLHGYDAPWPAGGGRNLMDTHTDSTETGSRHGLDYSLSNDVFSVSGLTEQNYCSIALSSLGLPDITLPAGTYRLYVFNKTGNYTPRITTINYSKYIYTSADTVLEEETTFTYLMSTDLGTGTQIDGSFKLMVVDTSTGVPTIWSPYSNICPITGFTGANIYVSPTQNQADATVYNVNWTSEAGTVYGGTVDVVTGKLTVDWASVDLTTGMMGGVAGSGYVFYKLLENAKTVPNSQIAPVRSEAYVPIRFNAIASNANCISIRDNGVIYVNTGGEDVQPIGKAVYELATPIEYTLTPQEVQTLVGQNNVWSDAGDVTVKV